MGSKGTYSRGGMQFRVHTACRRCGKHSFHRSKKVCSHCGFGKGPKLKTYTWQRKKVIGRANRKV